MEQENSFPTSNGRIQPLVHQLAQIEDTLREYLENGAGALVDPAGGKPTQLHQAREGLRLVRGELEQRARGWAKELEARNEELAAAQRETDVQRRRYQELFDQALSAYLVTDLWGVVQEANQAASDLLGLPQEELVGKSLGLYQVPGGQAAFDECLQQLRDGTVSAIRNWETRLAGRQGIPADVLISATSIRAPASEQSGLHWLIRDVSERKRTEEAQRESEEQRKVAEAVGAERQRLFDVLEALPPMICLLTPDYHVAFANRSFREKFGESHGRPCYEFCFGKTEPCGFCEAYTVLKTGQPRRWELVGADGSIIEAYDMPFTDVDGSSMILEIDIDISERKRAEAELSAASRYNRGLIEASLDPLVTISPDGKITDVNQATELATGVTRQYLIGTDFCDYFTEPDKARAGYEHVFREGFVHDYPLELQHRDGHVTSVLYSASVYRDETGQVQGVFAAARDVTKRKSAEEALGRANAYNRRLIEASLDPLVTIGPDGKITDVNAATEEATGYSRADLIGTDFSDYFTNPDKARAGYEYVFREGTVRDYALELQHRDGRVMSVLYNASLYRDEQGKVIGVFAAARDITEHKRAQEALIQTERLATMGRMAASLAHEVNNPIQSVVGCLGLAMEVLAEGEDAGMYMTVAMDELERAARIVHRMRDLGRQEEGHKEPGSVDELVDKVLILTQKQAQNARVQVSWEGDTDLPPVPMVRDQIQQVFLNLILNAIDAMPHGGALCIGATRTEETRGVCVSFADSGVGIAPEEVERLFEAFHSTKQLGLGLGLYVSRNIVQEHGGWIDVQSEVGVGTTFTVWLPAGGE